LNSNQPKGADLLQLLAAGCEDDEWEDSTTISQTVEVQHSPTPQDQTAVSTADSEDHEMRRQRDIDMVPDDQGRNLAPNGEQELFLNTCLNCGETWLLAIDFGDEFVCEDAGKSCGPSASKAAASTFHISEADKEDPDVDGQDTLPSLRTQLLKRVLAEGLTALASADLFLSSGLDPPKPGELDKCRADMQKLRAERAAAQRRNQAVEADRLTRKKQQRYLNGQLVDVQKGTKFLVEPKESAEDRMKTSCSIAILGTHSHPVRTNEKKGPKS
jgi:hypothetical protein